MSKPCNEFCPPANGDLCGVCDLSRGAHLTEPALLIEDRIARWREQDREEEGSIELLCDAEEELRRLRAVIPEDELEAAAERFMSQLDALLIEALKVSAETHPDVFDTRAELRRELRYVMREQFLVGRRKASENIRAVIEEALDDT